MAKIFNIELVRISNVNDSILMQSIEIDYFYLFQPERLEKSTKNCLFKKEHAINMARLTIITNHRTEK